MTNQRLLAEFTSMVTITAGLMPTLTNITILEHRNIRSAINPFYVGLCQSI
jgi:hypothetical protein